MTGTRAVIYVRQSIARDESVSLELQETACREHCKRHGYTVTQVLADPGISGRTWQRPGVKAALQAIESKQADVVVLWRWSRLSRSRLDWAVAVDRIESAGGRIESALEDVDVATSSGRFARGMLAEVAAFESERIGDGWREAQARRARAGLPHSGRPRFGYTYTPASGHAPDPDTAPILADLYTRYLAGETIGQLCAWLNSHSIPTTTGGVWHLQTLRRVLDSDFAAGMIRYQGRSIPGAHPAIITPDTHARYREARARRAGTGKRERSPYVLSGLVRCAECGGAMGVATRSGREQWTCIRSRDRRGAAPHPAFHVTGALLHRAVRAWLERVADQINQAANSTPLPAVADPAARRARDTLARTDARLLTLARKNLDGIITDAAYIALRDELGATRAALAREVAEHDARQTRADPNGQAAAHDLLRDWDLLAVAARREILATLIDHIAISAQPKGSLERVTVVPLPGVV